MPELRLGQEELSRTLSRAQEIAAAGPAASPLEERFAAYLQATDELGLPREAVIQALKEQLDIQHLEVVAGGRVFAPSADGFSYTATVVAEEKGGVKVRFDAGSEAVCDLTELRPFSLTPGTIIEGCWKGDDGWYAARVRKYDAEKGRVTVVYRADGVVEQLPLDRIRLAPIVRPSSQSRLLWAPVPVVDLALKLLAGGALGFLLARLLAG
jgi:hypothetical protein